MCIFVNKTGFNGLKGISVYSDMTLLTLFRNTVMRKGKASQKTTYQMFSLMNHDNSGKTGEGKRKPTQTHKKSEVQQDD